MQVQYACWNNSAAIRGWIQQQPYGKDADWSKPCGNPGSTWNGSTFANATTGTASCVFDAVFQEFILKTHRIAAGLNKTAIGWHEVTHSLLLPD